MTSSTQRGHIYLFFEFHTEKSLTRVVTNSSGSELVWGPTSERLGHGAPSVTHISPASWGPVSHAEALAHEEKLTGSSRKPEAQGCASQVQLQTPPDGAVRRVRVPGLPSPLIPPRGRKLLTHVHSWQIQSQCTAVQLSSAFSHVRLF